MDSSLAPAEVFSPRELAIAAEVPDRLVAHWIASGSVGTVADGYIAQDEAVRVIRALASGHRAPPATTGGTDVLFRSPIHDSRPFGLPAAASTTVHAMAIIALLVLTTVGAGRLATEERIPPDPLRLVYLTTPGPGGGGGGGGDEEPDPPSKSERAERAAPAPAPVRSPVPPRRPPRVVAAVRRPIAPPSRPPIVEPRAALAHEPQPMLTAPVASIPGDLRDRLGTIDGPSDAGDSLGSGVGDGVGSGAGAGLGSGQGPGIGPGFGGGVGGGPYRPGSGVDPPRLLREVRPSYSDEARRASVEGDVLLEVIILADGSVGRVEVVRRLGYGLEERAVEAVRQWQFAPATKQGVPVDVVVEVAVEFVLR